MKMDEKKLELLKSLEAEYKEAEDMGEASIFTAKELNAPMDMLRAEIAAFGPDLVSVLGEFFFMPFEETEVIYFTSVITLSNTVPEESADDVAAAVARLNYYIPCGCYALGEDDKNLVFKYTVPIVGEDETEHQTSAVSIAANTAIMTAERYMGYLKLILMNEVTVDEMIEMAKNGK
jgi:hypothetical protein